VEGPFQTTCQPSESCQGTFEHIVPDFPDMTFQPQAPSACPDGTNSNVFGDSTEPDQSYWNPTVSYSTPCFDCDVHCQTDGGFVPLPNETSSQASQESGKRQIAKLDPLKCPHCCKTVYSERQLKSHVPQCKQQSEQPIKCDVCDTRFTRPQDAARHRESSSCLDGSPPKRPWVCTCGKDYARKDRGLRHIKTASDRLKTTHTLQFRLA